MAAAGGRGVESRVRALQALVTSPHASNRIPARYGTLGLSPARLGEHIAWDRGAGVLARIVARRLGAPAHVARWSRLLVDLNRSLGHRQLMPEQTFGVRVPGNRRLSPDESERRLQLFYYPYRDRVTRDVVHLVGSAGRCVHLDIHSFAPVLDGVERSIDVGLLYDPQRPREADFAHRLRHCLAAHGLHVRMNYPYRGTSDGFATALRKRLPASRYLGLEIETNQRLLETPAGTRRMGRILAGCLVSCLPGSPQRN